MATRVINGLDELKSLVGQEIGTSEWLEITQDQVQKFAEATGDHQWIHCDPERAKRESPYGGAVAHGFLTLSLGPVLAQQIFTIDGVKMGVNYGLNRVRFPAAVMVGARVRMVSQLTELKEGVEGVTLNYKQTFEVEGEARPCCVAEMMVRLYF